MTIKLIATDMDGTFLDNHGEYDHPRFAKIYQELQRRDIQFVIASGHQAVELADFLRTTRTCGLSGVTARN
ncbi:HAD hydrolase family protein [Lactiplantibacillus carotarum]|uniref:HAD hydrolase family protein n=1 Tax=Lactiplantibacillus carotarum TaxID=2993456 RepID=UPI00298F2D3F|nr:HAD hydrolase family protein [Lactiplantibacillus carotarum]